MSAEKMELANGCGQPARTSFDPAAVAELAAALQARLRAHRQAGIVSYPLTPALQRFLAAETTRKGQPESRMPTRPPVDIRAEGGARSTVPRQTEGNLAALRADIVACRLCGLAQARQGQVLGKGEVSSGLMFLGDWSSQGEGFSDEILFGVKEDVMLWNMVLAMGLTQDAVHVTNAVQCCPPAGRTPDPESSRQCQQHLRRSIALMQPRIICAMGEVAAAAVLGHSESVFRLRGRFHEYVQGGEVIAGLHVAVTFHPRVLLAQPDLKKAAWQDLQMIQRRLRQTAGAQG